MRLAPGPRVRISVRMKLTVLVVASGCGSPSVETQERAACTRLEAVCDEKAPACRSDIADLKADLGSEGYGKFLTCASGAGTCGEWLGCAIGGLGVTDREAQKELAGLSKGLRRMVDDEPGGDEPAAEATRDDEPPLPPQCARLDELCAADEPSVRSRCTRMVRNLRSDTENLGKLATCFGDAKNCYALDNCMTELWFELD